MSKNIVVTGGASFIGSHLVESLLERGDEVTIADNFSSGSKENIEHFRKHVRLFEEDLRDPHRAETAIPAGTDIVYHLAADHGGRGYVETEEVACATNFVLDQNVFQAAMKKDVSGIIFASSGCIYPMYLQNNVSEFRYLREEDAGPPYEPDGLYGWAKMVGELSLEAIQRETGIPTGSARFFTVYGPRGKENHAIMAMIARTFIQQNPFGVWGDGTALRNWTHVTDIVRGLLEVEKNLNSAKNFILNIGTIERTSVKDAIELVLETTRKYQANYQSYFPVLEFNPTKPVGPLNRVADNSKFFSLTGIEPISLATGIIPTIDWYHNTHSIQSVIENLERLLIAKK